MVDAPRQARERQTATFPTKKRRAPASTRQNGPFSSMLFLVPLKKMTKRCETPRITRTDKTSFFVIAVDAPRRARGRQTATFVPRKRRATAFVFQNPLYVILWFVSVRSHSSALAQLPKIPKKERAKSSSRCAPLRAWDLGKDGTLGFVCVIVPRVRARRVACTQRHLACLLAARSACSLRKTHA